VNLPKSKALSEIERHWKRAPSLKGTEWQGIDWIDTDQDRNKWQAPVNTVPNLLAP